MIRTNYCSCNIEKIKTLSDKGRGSMGERWKHNVREYIPRNVDPELSYLNEDLVPLQAHSYRDAFDETIAEAQAKGTMGKVRKNAVYGLEFELSFSYMPEIFDLDSWKQANLDWLYDHFGESNVKHAVLHMDEACGPHIHAFVVPMDEKGHLNCKHFINGPKDMSDLQTSYYEEVGQYFGLCRGIKKSPVTHKEIAKFKQDTLKRATIKEEDLEPRLEERLPDGNIKPEYVDRVKELAQAYSYQSLDRANLQQQKINEEMARLANERIRLAKEKKEYEKKKEAIEKLSDDLAKRIDEQGEDYEQIKKMLRTYDMLTRGLKQYPDRDIAKQTANQINKITSWQHQQDKQRRKEIEEQFGF